MLLGRAYVAPVLNCFELVPRVEQYIIQYYTKYRICIVLYITRAYDAPCNYTASDMPALRKLILLELHAMTPLRVVHQNRVLYDLNPDVGLGAGIGTPMPSIGVPTDAEIATRKSTRLAQMPDRFPPAISTYAMHKADLQNSLVGSTVTILESIEIYCMGVSVALVAEVKWEPEHVRERRRPFDKWLRSGELEHTMLGAIATYIMHEHQWIPFTVALQSHNLLSNGIAGEWGLYHVHEHEVHNLGYMGGVHISADEIGSSMHVYEQVVDEVTTLWDARDSRAGGCKCINDAEGLVGCTNNTILEPDGQVHVTHNIPPLSNPLTCIGDSEYFLGYGELYWKVHNTKKQTRWKPRVNGRLSSVTGV